MHQIYQYFSSLSNISLAFVRYLLSSDQKYQRSLFHPFTPNLLNITLSFCCNSVVQRLAERARYYVLEISLAIPAKFETLKIYCCNFSCGTVFIRNQAKTEVINPASFTLDHNLAKEKGNCNVESDRSPQPAFFVQLTNYLKNCKKCGIGRLIFIFI